jgi:hypothetical protein
VALKFIVSVIVYYVQYKLLVKATSLRTVAATQQTEGMKYYPYTQKNSGAYNVEDLVGLKRENRYWQRSKFIFLNDRFFVHLHPFKFAVIKFLCDRFILQK